MKKLYKLIFSVSTLSAGLVSLTACNNVKNDQTGKDTKEPTTQVKPSGDQKPQDGGSNTTTPAAPSGDQKPQDDPGKKTETEEKREEVVQPAPSAQPTKEFTFDKTKSNGSSVEFSLKVKSDSTLNVEENQKLFLTITVNKVNENGESALSEDLELESTKLNDSELGIKFGFKFAGSITNEEIRKGQKFYQIKSLKIGADKSSANEVQLTNENVQSNLN